MNVRRGQAIIAVSLAAAAVAAIVVFARLERDPWPRLVRMVERSRLTVAGRFAVLEVGRRLPVTRSVRGSTQRDNELRVAALALLASNADDHKKAIAAILLGDPVGAEKRLSLLARAGAPAAVWNDLAVVLTAQSATTEDETLVSALAAVDRAIDADPTLLPARFNRAMIIEALGIPHLAEKAYADYLRLDGSSQWAADARERIRAIRSRSTSTAQWRDVEATLHRAAGARDLEAVARAVAMFPQEARTTMERIYLPLWGTETLRGDSSKAGSVVVLSRLIGETLLDTNGEALPVDAVRAIDRAVGNSERLKSLATGHRLFGEAFALNQARETSAAATKFEAARLLLEPSGSPVALLARYFFASAAVDQGERARALGLLDDLLADTPEAYRSLRAAIHRLRGTIMGFEGSLEDALRRFEAARDAFLGIGEVKNATDMDGRMAAVLALLGRPGEAWPIYRRSLRIAGASGASRTLQSTLHAATFVALQDQRWDLAHALLNLEVELGPVTPTLYAEALLWRVLAAERAQMSRATSIQIEAARREVGEMKDGAFRDVAENELRLIEAILAERDAPEIAVMLFTEHLGLAESRGRLTHRPQVLVRRAGALRRLARHDQAENDLRAAICIIEERTMEVERDLLRDSFLGKANAAYTALADLLDARGDYQGALDAADRPRGRILLDRAAGPRHPAPDAVALVSSVLEPRTALLFHAVFPDRLVIYVIRRNGLQRFETGEDAVTVVQSVRRFIDRIISGDDTLAIEEGRRLHDALVAPARSALAGVDRLVIVTDPVLDPVPFGALVQPNGQFLLEDFALTVAPGVAAYATPRTRLRRRSERIVSVGNPRLADSLFESLPSLKAAEREAQDVAAMYSDAAILLNEEATRSRVLAFMERADVIHFATHAIEDVLNPGKSRLLLAVNERGLQDSLDVAGIAEMQLRRAPTVILAGCRTAATGRSHGFTQTLAAAFLAAGARDVVGSLWDIEDTAGREFSLALHRALRGGLESDFALREAQLHLLRSPHVQFRSMRAWSAMRLQSVN